MNKILTKEFNEAWNELSEILTEKIVKIGSKWQVQSEKGRNMGTYDTKEEAEERLRQVHYFKYKNEELIENIEKHFLDYCKDRNIKYTLTDDGLECATWRDYIKLLDLLGDMRIPFKTATNNGKRVYIDKQYLVEDIKFENTMTAIGAFNELDKLNESSMTGIRYENIINGTQAIDQQVINISIELTKRFGIENPDKWPYQLQLMCNAYITEKGVLNILNDKEKMSIINKKLSAWYANNNIESKYIKYFNNNGYEFNGEHEILSTAANNPKDKTNVDLIAVTPQNTMFNNVEVKATKFNTDRAKDFHNAEAVFIYRIDENILYLKIRRGKNLVLTDITYPINFKCICIKPTAGVVVPWQKEYDSDEF